MCSKREHDILDLQCRLDAEETRSRRHFEELIEYQEKEWAVLSRNAPEFKPTGTESYAMHSDAEAQRAPVSGSATRVPTFLSGGARPVLGPSSPSGGAA
eukprot:3908096-Lingulodinium_polyedra.AAC.1